MKIKVSYGVDTRLWRYNQNEENETKEQLYQDLLAYVCKTFEFTNPEQFRITFKDDDDEMTTIASHYDFHDAFISAEQQKKKSLKLHIVNIPSDKNKPAPVSEPEGKLNVDDEKKESVPIQSTINDEPESAENNESNKPRPSPEEIQAFLADDLVIDLLSDLFVSVFEALQAAKFEIGFMECLQGIILSDDGKYAKITENPLWPYFVDEFLAKHSVQIDGFIIPMMMRNGALNTDTIKQWIPMILNMMKMKVKAGGMKCGGFRGRGGWRGRGWRHHHGQRRGGFGHHGPHGHHRGYNGRRGGWRGHRGGRRGWRHHHEQPVDHGFPPFPVFTGFNGHNPWFQAPQNQGLNGNDEDQMEMEVEVGPFEFDEQLVAVMNMGFGDIDKIKTLLVKYKGNKERVVQELVGEKNE